uniref:NADH dehydrogenase subunit 3 n=1 Tax=Regioscalpellum regium TaxID=2977353 RepID=UPI0021CCA4EB|nr:NADH dehydrogenase subunit 3 [Regioscalpellum regium]UWM13002.1 NADH dehydrogenase subunit 3 [Regioscalpellum regium]
MNFLIFSFLMTFGISVILITVACVASKKVYLSREKSSPFECGFDPKNTSRIPFSIRFFLIAIIFLIFDIEISILLPLGVIIGNLSPFTWLFTGSIFLGLVTLGLYYEWSENTLEWLD